MKIVFITTSSINGGAQKHMRDMFLKLSQRENEVHLIAPEGWLTTELNQYADNVHYIRGSISEYRKVTNLISIIAPDIINTFILSGGILGYLAWCHKKKGKIFITVNNPILYDGIKPANRILYPFLYRYMAQRANAFLVKSEKVGIEVKRTIKDKKPVFSIKNGIDFSVYDRNSVGLELREKLKVPEDAILVTTTGALEERKGQRYLIDAVVKLRKDKKSVYCWIAGGGSLQETLEKYIEENDADEYIKLIGNRKDIPEVLRASDVYVLPSLHEGLPNSLMEAMAMGLPCIATDVGGVRELIDDQQSGVIVHPKDSIAIYHSILQLIERPEYKISLGEKAYKKIKESYSIDKAVEELEAIYYQY